MKDLDNIFTDVYFNAQTTDTELNQAVLEAIERAKQQIIDLINREVVAEAKWWEYNIIPAVRNKQVERDVNKRLAELNQRKDK